jgi:L-2,4-diaminobutyrate decarboxylase
VFFRDVARANAAISFGGAYLAAPNIGLQGSHGATAVPLLAMLLAWGRSGIAARVEHCVEMAEELADFVESESRLVLFARPRTGIAVWRPDGTAAFERIHGQLPPGIVSTVTIAGERWFRMVAADPQADVETIIERLRQSVV